MCGCFTSNPSYSPPSMRPFKTSLRKSHVMQICSWASISARHDLNPAQRIARGISSNEARSGRCPFNFTLNTTVRGYTYGPRRLDLSNRFTPCVFRPHPAAQTIHVVRRASRGVDDAGLVLLLEAARACPSLIELVLHRNTIADTGAVALAAHVRGWPGLVDVHAGAPH
jgi:hypothetical protein